MMGNYYIRYYIHPRCKVRHAARVSQGIADFCDKELLDRCGMIKVDIIGFIIHKIGFYSLGARFKL